MKTLVLNYNSNDYKLDERTQIKFVFTVKGELYTKLLVNTINNVKFESYNNFIIYSFEEDSSKILDKYKLPYKKSYGVNIYQDKVLNTLQTSIDNPDTLIIHIDIMTNFDFKDVRGIFGRLKYNNKLYTISCKYTDCNSNHNVDGKIFLAYNMNLNNLKDYYNCIENTKERFNYSNKDNFNRYMKETNNNPTEEEVLTFNLNNLNYIEHENIEICNRILRGFYFCNGGTNINKMFNEKLIFNRGYYIDWELIC